MKRIGLLKLTQSFPVRLSFFLILVTSAVFIVAFLGFYDSARKQVMDEAVAHAELAVGSTVLRVEKVLQGVEIAVNNMAWNIDGYLDSPDSMYNLTDQLLRNNPYIVGSAIAFEPYYFPEKGMQFSPYSCYSGDSIIHFQLGTEEYEYHYVDWYQIPKLLNQPYWSEPYLDDGGAGIRMSTYSKPLYDKDGKMYAVFTADISLDWFTNLVNSIKPYPRSYNFMIGRGGTYLVHHFQERILSETIFSATLDMKDPAVAQIGKAMIDGEKGMAILHNEDTLCYTFYAPIESTGWSVGLVCPQEEVLAGLNEMKFNVSVVFAIGIIVMLVCCYHIVRKQTKPLIEFAASAKKIAEGNFNASLPQIKSRDEMKMLRDSFEFMQQSLVDYTEELKLTTANRERIESELRIASDIQMGMIPKIFPPFPDRSDVDLYATLIPAREVGGDLYDFFISDEKLFFTVGDVSGKGVPASLLMAVTRTLFRNMATHLKKPHAIVRALNESITESNDSGMFVTLFLGVIDLKTGNMEFCNAGHNPPVLHHQGGGKFLETIPNIPLGVFQGFEYQMEELQLEPNTILFTYTDGVTEAEDPDKKLFTEERLLRLFGELNPIYTPKEKLEKILDMVQLHAGGAEQSDDITMLCVHYLPEKS